MPFGVGYPEFTNEPVEKENQQAHNELEAKTSEPDAQQTEDVQEKVQEMLELDKLEKFKFEGKEWTLKDLKNSMLMRQDYTKKTAELAKERRFVENFDVDLDKVLKNPSLMAQFSKVYPPSYVERAKSILSRISGEPEQAASKPQQREESVNIPPELQNRIDTLEQQLQAFNEDRVTAIQEKLDTWFNELGNKYKIGESKVDAAIERLVEQDASQAAEQGKKITKDFLEQSYKSYSEHFSSLKKQEVKQKQQAQINVSKRAVDMGPGGDAPGTAPQGPKTMKDARKAFLSHFGAQ